MWRSYKLKKKFLIVGDLHLDSRNPQSRLDNYMESCLAKLRETLQIAKHFEVDYYILLGDIFDRIEVGGLCRNRALETLLSEFGVPWSFEKYVVIGNHDIAHNESNLEKSALNTLIAAGAIKCIDKIEDLNIRFLHFTPDLDERLRNGELMNISNKIYFCHASIVDKPSRFDHVLFSDLAYSDSTKLIVSGHIHSPMEATSQSGVKFFNPGSLGRTKIDEKHDPQVLLIQYDFDTDNIKHKFLKLKKAMSSDIVFDVEKNNQKKIENKNTQLFIESITSQQLVDSSTPKITSDLIADLQDFGEKTSVPKDVIDMAKDVVNIVKTGGEL